MPNYVPSLHVIVLTLQFAIKNLLWKSLREWLITYSHYAAEGEGVSQLVNYLSPSAKSV